MIHCDACISLDWDFPIEIAWYHSRLGMLPIVTTCAPPASSASEFFSLFLLPLPISGFLPFQYNVFKLLGRAERLLCADLSSCSRCFGLLRAGKSQPLLMAGGGNASRSMRSRIAANNFRVIATSASWNVKYFACRMTFAPIFTSFSCSVVSDQCFTSLGSASRRTLATCVSCGGRCDRR